jgi:hypothetical protein
MHHLKLLQKKNHMVKDKMVKGIEQSRNIQKNLQSNNLSTLNYLSSELGKIQNSIQTKMANKIQ